MGPICVVERFQGQPNYLGDMPLVTGDVKLNRDTCLSYLLLGFDDTTTSTPGIGSEARCMMSYSQ